MQAGYFPATTRNPVTAFSFEILKRFHLASLESKSAAYDYIGTLRRLTDNCQTADVPDPYPAFLPTSRMYEHLQMLIHLGQAHGIDELMPYQPAGNLVVPCPVCPQYGLNIKGDIPETPPWLRHIMQLRTTLDGNFHTGHFIKNSDPNDIPLCDGQAQFPPDGEYREYLKSVPLTKEKSTCTYLKAANRQDKKKVKNMDVVGTINAQCSHVFVVATVDMPHAERFTLALDHAITYDIACEYYANIVKRFKESPHLRDVADLVERAHWGIPALHVTGHKPDCTYLFDVTLYNDLCSAKKLYEEKRDLFIGLSLSNRDKLQKWLAMSRQTTQVGSEVKSVYRHTSSKVPSQTAIYQEMVANVTNFVSTQIPSNEVAVFLNEGLKMQENQRKIVYVRKKHAEHELESTKQEITTRRAKLTTQMVKWREVQGLVIPEAADRFAVAQACEIEKEILWLPSDFTNPNRVALGQSMVALGEEEGRLRKGEAYDFIRVLQTVCKTLSALEDRKRVDEAGQINHTIAGDQVLDTRDRRDYFIESYNAVRTALIALEISDATHPEGAFPHLTIVQTFMKSRRRERALGDSRRGDGLLFTTTGVASGSKIAYPPQDNDNDSTDTDAGPDAKRQNIGGGTQMTMRKKKKPPAERKKDKQALQAAYDADPKNKNGWLWELRKPSNMTNEEMKQWEEEGDRVQWARAEADMDRFQEQSWLNSCAAR
ncbi:hypothetical protein C8J57DRAFT_1539218 [Mycena rebaudengoi]|nr:hypothetical protein C8J57DRAFT_1539218 [Mycena rebaudengoi]